VIRRPAGIGAFEFVVLASLRVGQLALGCQPRVDGAHKNAVVAQLEVSQGKVRQATAQPPRVASVAI
jgi:DNA-directed RNA polymerase subunit K/omega